MSSLAWASASLIALSISSSERLVLAVIATEKLTAVFYEISEKLYSQVNQNNAAGAGAEAQDANASTDNNGETVYDAEYKVEDEDNKNENK